MNAKIAISDAENSAYNLAPTDIKIKIRGNSTAGLDKKPYNIKFDKKTSIFGWAKGKKYCLLANRYDKSLIRNYLAFKLSSQLRLAYTVSYKFVDLWLNGVYKGNYLVTTPIETGKNRLDIDTDDNDVLLERESERQEEDVSYITTPVYKLRFAIDDPENPTESQLTSYNTVLTNAENAMQSQDYNEIVKYIDVNSFTDFFILDEYLKPADVDYSSTRYYIQNNKLYASPAWDYDLSSGNEKQNRYAEIVYSYKSLFALNMIWMRNLMKCDAFKTQFINRFNELSDVLINLYDKDIDEIVNKYKNAFLRDSEVAGWGFTALGLDRVPEDTYMGNVNFLKNWLKKRYIWLYVDFNLDHSAYDRAVSLASSLTSNDAVDRTRLNNALSEDLWKENITQSEIDAMTAEILDAGLEYSDNLTAYLNNQVNDTNEKLSATTNSLTATQNKLNESVKANETAQADNSKLTASIKAQDAELSDLKTKSTTANNSLTAVQSQLNEALKTNETSKEESSNLKTSIQTKEAELNDLKTKLDAANNSLTTVQSQLNDAVKASETVQEENKNLTTANQTKETELNDLKSQLTTINNSLTAAQVEIKKLKANSSTAKKKTVHATSTSISNKTKKIKAKAYKDNKYLKTITVPASVTEIGNQAFYNCKNVNKIVIKSKKLKKIGKQAFKKTGSVNYKKLVVTVPKKKLKTYKKMLIKAGLSKKATIKAS